MVQRIKHREYCVECGAGVMLDTEQSPDGAVFSVYVCTACGHIFGEADTLEGMVALSAFIQSHIAALVGRLAVTS